MRRVPQAVEQCVGCGDEVAVYSARQRVDGEAMCGGCRRVHRAHVRTVRRAVVAAVAPVVRPACDHDPATSPTGVRYCRVCLDRLAAEVTS